MDPNATIAILLCTYNGAEFLPQQLASFAAQTHTHWHLYASDDGSSDTTVEILSAFTAEHPGKVTLLYGPKRGFVQHFFTLISNPDVKADGIAFSDQDDIWQPDRLSRGIAALSAHPAALPALYGTRTRYIDTASNPLTYSKRFSRKPSFANALVQCLMGGNTMLLNTPAWQLLKEAYQKAGGLAANTITSHDWLAYLLVSGAGGVVIYDPYPSLDYRQHSGNLAGGNRGLNAALNRMRRLLKGELKSWIDCNEEVLKNMQHRLTEDARQRFATFTQARRASFISRLIGFRRAGIYRQTTLGNLGLLVAALRAKV